MALNRGSEHTPLIGNNSNTQTTSWASWGISCATWAANQAWATASWLASEAYKNAKDYANDIYQNPEGIAITTITSCITMVAGVATTGVEDAGSYAGWIPYIYALEPLARSISIAIKNRAEGEGNAIDTIISGAAVSARAEAFMSTAFCYALVNAGHDITIPVRVLLSIGSVALNTWLNMNAAEQTTTNLKKLPEYWLKLNNIERSYFIISNVLSLILSLAGSTPMMTAVVDASEKLGIPYDPLQASNNTLFLVDCLLLMHPMIVRGFMDFAQWVERCIRKSSDIQKQQESIEKLPSILSNPDKLPRFMKKTEHFDAEASDITAIIKAIKSMTEFEQDSQKCCTALFYKTLAGLFVLGINIGYVYITASQITQVGNYKQLGFFAEIPKSLLAGLDAVWDNIAVGDTTLSALVLNSGNFFFPAVGGFKSLLDMIKVIADYSILMRSSIIINTISAGFGLLSIGTVLAMGSGMKIAYLAACSPFFLNTSAAPEEMWKLVLSKETLTQRNAAIANFCIQIEAAAQEYKTSTDEDKDTAYATTILASAKEVITTLRGIATATQSGNESNLSIASSQTALSINAASPLLFHHQRSYGGAGPLIETSGTRP